MKLKDILYENEYECENPSADVLEISNITRKIEEIDSGSLFFLLKSINSECENIINNIKEMRPLAVVCEKGRAIEDKDLCVLYVENVRCAMAYAYSRFSNIDYGKTKFIAVTGTNGKTTTATLIKELLRSNGENVGFIGTGRIEINGEKISEDYYSMTTPDPELLYPAISKMQNAGCRYIVMEASSHALYFDKLAPIPYEIGIFTNLSSEHLDFHKNLEAYYESKLKLFSQCKTGIFNCDDKYSRRALCTRMGKTESVGILWPADAVAREITQKGFLGTEYIYKEKSLIFRVKTRLVGAYNVYNTLFALKAVILLGMKPCRAKSALEKIESIRGRFDVSISDITVIRDYAHTPVAFENLLKTAKALKKTRQKITVVFGCGGERDKTKRPVMGGVAEKYSDFSIVTADNSRSEPESEIISDILKGYKNTEKRIVINDRKKAIEYAVINALPDDIVIISGKGDENYIIDKSGVHPFSEKQIIKDSLAKRERREVYDENKLENSPD